MHMRAEERCRWAEAEVEVTESRSVGGCSVTFTSGLTAVLKLPGDLRAVRAVHSHYISHRFFGVIASRRLHLLAMIPKPELHRILCILLSTSLDRNNGSLPSLLVYAVTW